MVENSQQIVFNDTWFTNNCKTIHQGHQDSLNSALINVKKLHVLQTLREDSRINSE